MWWGHPYGPGFFPFVFPFGFFVLVVLCIVIFRIISFRKFSRFSGGCGRPMYAGWHTQQDEPGVILKRRLANGDISEDEYHRLREMLKSQD